ncbi:hypothetical protein [Candidatus Contendibacter odensensis]|uniref:Uncharacterized protein n=1 Tax=Candidatus Contendobacter odensis Run_B_J11 TaxID=1400861 RepID=A0A7U7GFK7_9GAMM|nr:hypothetical protein [Candidatus Contendobacter odensis]CDH46981.1 hypothetical protein BN874_690031 [Candidatus Contendobacter odensis Run_B_J11]
MNLWIMGLVVGLVVVGCWHGAKKTKMSIWWWLMGAAVAAPPLWIVGVVIFAVSGAASRPSTPGMPPDNAYTCLDYIRGHLDWKDRKSLRIEGKPDTTVDGKLATITIHVNAKNSFGAYGGAESFICQLYNGKIITATKGVE